MERNKIKEKELKNSEILYLSEQHTKNKLQNQKELDILEYKVKFIKDILNKVIIIER